MKQIFDFIKRIANRPEKQEVKEEVLSPELESLFAQAIRWISSPPTAYRYNPPLLEQRKALWQKLVQGAKKTGAKALVIDTIQHNSEKYTEEAKKKTYTTEGLYNRMEKTILISRNSGAGKVMSFLHEFVHHVDHVVVGMPRPFPDMRNIETVAHIVTFMLALHYFKAPWIQTELSILPKTYGVTEEDIQRLKPRILLVAQKVLEILEGQTFSRTTKDAYRATYAT